MTNEFLEAVEGNEDKTEDSSERFRKLKRREAGTEHNEAEKRYQELKEEAKREFVEKQEERESDEDGETDKDNYVTY